MRIKVKVTTVKDKAQWYFTICARNGKVIATSETYRSLRTLEKGAMVVISTLDPYWRNIANIQLEKGLIAPERVRK